MQRRLRLIAVFIVVIIFIACSKQPSGDTATISIALPTAKTSFANVDVAIAQEMGFFKQQGLNVSIKNLDSAVKVVQAVVANDAAIGGSSFEPVINAASAGGNLAIIGTYANRLTVSMVTPKTIKSVGDLRGRNVGVQDIGAFREIMTRMVLQTAQLTPQDVKYIPISPPSYIQALKSGQIESAILQTEQVAEILKRDPRFHVLVDLHKVEPDYYYGSYIVRKDWLTKNSDIAVRYLTALIQAHRFMYDNKAETIKIAAKTTGFDPGVITHTYDVLLGKHKVFPTGDGIEEKRLAYTLSRMKSLGLLKGKEPDLTQLVDRKPITLALNKLGK
ncbi:ABC transporter substrate-binding protein [Aetokthonos hydrillicola Thurmond2011]|jgi:ABC-type nitrate/sulfonate/bicarbonate transport system substrate-binding protein|uniref:ABC transporter substrate-binding protein n=1 Tax=Aetokthonos hydrillicola Thurmond2011 TaxID=2712845 RepID=A0AAP5IE96_9CYAN|nr:ABC transporter substrate-binding protein [Aetokthonos hydrillicola]MBO3463951.1 ABC transporter substrate-binding protein [Aetokthonos hydrillicola CCALA 1050]MBW4589204.1 ABC transporter substrate-binding protein [Aetokthonos hydrillicola CCALA 1050]MDR9898764.1 ABC transporter substrate-binding protein [Aetokthonos hydrillicola Thurmond2011]